MYVLAVDSNNASKIVPVPVSVVGCVLPETVHIIYFGRNRKKNKSETAVTIVKHDFIIGPESDHCLPLSVTD